MVASRLDWKASVRFLAGGCAVLFGGCASRIGTSAICGAPKPSAGAGSQSIDALYRAATKLQADRADTIDRESGVCQRPGRRTADSPLPAPAGSAGKAARRGKQRRKKSPRAPQPRRSAGPGAGGGVFLLLRSVRLRLWLRVAPLMGRPLVPHVALLLSGAIEVSARNIAAVRNTVGRYNPMRETNGSKFRIARHCSAVSSKTFEPKTFGPPRFAQPRAWHRRRAMRSA